MDNNNNKTERDYAVSMDTTRIRPQWRQWSPRVAADASQQTRRSRHIAGPAGGCAEVNEGALTSYSAVKGGLSVYLFLSSPPHPRTFFPLLLEREEGRKGTLM